MVQIKIKNTSTNKNPIYQTENSAGMDICAFITHPITILVGKRVLIPTGLSLEIPKGHEIQIRPRSGLALKNGITVLNSPGTIDSDYRGEIMVLLINLGEEDFEIKPGDRIAQLILSKHEVIEWEVTKQLSDSERGIGGFGSTGK